MRKPSATQHSNISINIQICKHFYSGFQTLNTELRHIAVHAAVPTPLILLIQEAFYICFTITKNDTMGCKQDRTVVCHVFCNENVHTARGGWRAKRVERAGLEIIKILMTQYQMQWAY